MPKMIDPALREHAVRLVREYRGAYPSNAKAIAAVTRQEGLGAESLRRWVVQAEIDAGNRDGQTSKEHAEIRHLKAENQRLREDVAMSNRAAVPHARPRCACCTRCANTTERSTGCSSFS